MAVADAPTATDDIPWDLLRPDVVVVSPLAPAQDGIARYAEQFVARLRTRRSVRTIANPYGHGDLDLDLRGGFRILRLLRATRKTDSVVIQWYVNYYTKGSFLSTIVSHLALALFFRLRHPVVVVHEPYEPRRTDGGWRQPGRDLKEALLRFCWASKMTLLFHTEWERARFLARFPSRLPRVTRILNHDVTFTPLSERSQAEARQSLSEAFGNDRVFLCIGFLKWYKGFDRAIKAFAEMRATGTQLYVVGAAIPDTEDVRSHLRDLRRLVAATPGVSLREVWVSDEDFDTWLQAADWVVAPYRSAASSGVVARAHVVGRQVIMSSAGGLSEQAGVGDIVEGSDEELRAAMASCLLDAGQA